MEYNICPYYTFIFKLVLEQNRAVFYTYYKSPRIIDVEKKLTRNFLKILQTSSEP